MGYNCFMSRRHFYDAIVRPMKFDISEEDLGPNLWFAFTAISGLSRLFTYTPPILEEAQEAAKAAESEGIEDILDNKSP